MPEKLMVRDMLLIAVILCTCFLVYLCRDFLFFRIVLERIFPFLALKRNKESNDLSQIYEKAKADINSETRFIRTSTFKKICHPLENYKLTSKMNQNLVSKYISSLQDSKNAKNEFFYEKDLEFANQLFKDSSGKSALNEEQTAAVVSDEDSNLIIAGAGSGKTTVIAHKVKYLVEKGCDPKNILLLSFTKASAASLQQRIERTMGIKVVATTLHAFAYSIKKEVQQKRPTIADEKQLYAKAYEALLNTLSESTYLHFFLEFYRKYFYDIKPLVYYKNMKNLRQDLKNVNDQAEGNNEYFLPNQSNQKFSTLNGELVRSIDERYIADFLFIHGIKYQYEKKYELASYSYYPDFYLSDYDIYLEHFAIDKNGKAPPTFENPEEYVMQIQKKRQLHIEKGTRLIETQTWALNEENSDEYLIKILNAANVKTKAINTSVIEHISRKFNQFIYNFYVRWKLSGKTIVELKRKHTDVRYQVFLSFYERFATEFEKLKATEKLSDFSDLLSEATDILHKDKISNFYKYIIVDEFQDTSWNSMKLLDAIYEASPGSSYFMVGDDWQSIYGFNGTDVTILMQFRNRSGCEVKYLNKNYRSHQRIVDLGKKFIERNDKQFKKEVISANQKHSESLIEFIYVDQLEDKIRQIDKNESIFLLGRYNDDEPVLLINELKKIGYSNLEFNTIHKSKGLEATHVFILFPNNAKREFPSNIQDHYIFDILKRNSESFPFAEERRLMYVAMTRAEKNLYFVSPFTKKSPNSEFWEELYTLINKPEQDS